MTGMYNVVAKLRTGEPLTPQGREGPRGRPSNAVIIPRAGLNAARHDEFLSVVRQALTDQRQARTDRAAAPIA